MDVPLPIQLAAKEAGLTPFVIRAWEKRYGVVAPQRTGSNRRLYSQEAIERLRLLGTLTQAGHRIGDIAQLPTETLRERAVEVAPAAKPRPAAARGFSSENALDEAIEAVRSMDANALGSILDRSAVALGQRGLLERFTSPLARRIGELWAAGSLTAAHEHFASNELRQFLLRDSRSFVEGANAPLVVVTTPAGQLHELGAAIAAAAARDNGWRVLYLGANLPAADIAHAASGHGARLIALSIVFPTDDPALPGEIALLRRLVPPQITIIAGGASAPAYGEALRLAGIPIIDDLEAFSHHLAQSRGLARR